MLLASPLKKRWSTKPISGSHKTQVYAKISLIVLIISQLYLCIPTTNAQEIEINGIVDEPEWALWFEDLDEPSYKAYYASDENFAYIAFIMDNDLGKNDIQIAFKAKESEWMLKCVEGETPVCRKNGDKWLRCWGIVQDELPQGVVLLEGTTDGKPSYEICIPLDMLGKYGVGFPLYFKIWIMYTTDNPNGWIKAACENEEHSVNFYPPSYADWWFCHGQDEPKKESQFSILVNALIQNHGPRLILSGGEIYLPDAAYPVFQDDQYYVGIDYMTSPQHFDFYDFTASDIIEAEVIANEIYDEWKTAHPNTASTLNWGKKISDELVYGNLDRATTYVRVIKNKQEYIDLQFWMFYPFNGPGKFHAHFDSTLWWMFLSSILPTDYDYFLNGYGRHFGDWEMASLRLSRDSDLNYYDPSAWSITEINMTAHGDEKSTRYSLNFDEIEFNEGHPMIYVAEGSHAFYHAAPWDPPERGALHWEGSDGWEDFDIDYLKWMPYERTSMFLGVVYPFDMHQSGGPIFDTSIKGNYEVLFDGKEPDWIIFNGNWGQWLYNSDEYAAGYEVAEGYRFGSSSPSAQKYW